MFKSSVNFSYLLHTVAAEISLNVIEVIRVAKVNQILIKTWMVISSYWWSHSILQGGSTLGLFGLTKKCCFDDLVFANVYVNVQIYDNL